MEVFGISNSYTEPTESGWQRRTRLQFREPIAYHRISWRLNVLSQTFISTFIAWNSISSSKETSSVPAAAGVHSRSLCIHQSGGPTQQKLTPLSQCSDSLPLLQLFSKQLSKTHDRKHGLPIQGQKDRSSKYLGAPHLHREGWRPCLALPRHSSVCQ